MDNPVVDPLISPEQHLDQLASEETVQMTPEEMAAQIVTEIAEHESECSSILDEVKINTELWMGIPTALQGLPDDAVFAKTSVMEIYRVSETVHANMIADIFGQEPWLETSAPTEDPEQVNEAGDWQQVLEHQLRRMKFRSKIDPSLRWLIVNGTEVVETPWQFEVRWNDAGKEYVREEVRDNPDYIHVPLVTFHVQPGALDIEGDHWTIQELEVMPNKLKAMLAASRSIPGAIIDDDALERALKSNENQKSTDAKTRVDDLRTVRGYQGGQKTGKVHVSIRWGVHMNKPDSPIVWKIISVNNRFVVAQIPNPFKQGYKPYLKGTFIPLENSFYGMGFGKLFAGKQIEMNHNRSLMRNKFMQWVIGEYQQEGGVYEADRQIFHEPGAVRHKDEFGTLTEIPCDMSGMQVGVQLESMDKEDVRIGANAGAMAQSQATGVTATENKGLMTEQIKRNMPASSNIIENLVQPFVERMMEQDDQFLPEVVRIFVLGENGRMQSKVVQKQSLMPGTGVFIRCASDMDFRIATQRRKTSLLQIMANAAVQFKDAGFDLQAEGFSPVPFIRSLAKTFDENPRDVFNEERKAAYLQQQELKTQIMIETKKKQARLAADPNLPVEQLPGALPPALQGTPGASA